MTCSFSTKQQIQEIMKTLAQSFIAALLLSTATLASTAANPLTPSSNPTATTSSYKVAVFPSSTAPSRLNVFVERNPGQQMIISFKSAEGKVLAKEFINKKQGNFHFQFDMSELEDGAYTVEVVSGNDVTTHPVTLSTTPAQTATRAITLK